MNATAVINVRSPQEWAGRIATAWRASLDSILETGRLLIEAKRELPHGSFKAMIERDLPFQHSTAARLMAVAADERISNVAHVQLLPASWGTLYELTKLPDDVFAAKLADGTVHPGMQRSEALRLVKAKPNHTPEPFMQSAEAMEVPRYAGAKIFLPDGADIVGLCREGIALEQNGATIDEAAAAVGLTDQAYRISRQIVFLADHIPLSSADAAVIAEALTVLTTTLQLRRAWEIAEPVAIRVWGQTRNWLGLVTLADRRLERFEQTFAIVMQSCLTTDEIELPYLSVEQVSQATKEIQKARKALAAFAARIEELHA